MVHIHENVEAAQKQQNTKTKQDAAVDSSLKKIKNKYIVLSGKGGVGKTSTSVNLSMALADKGFNVGIMDVDLHGPDVPRMLGLKGMLDLSQNNKLNPMRYSENLKVVSIESLIASKDDAIIWRGPLKYSAIRQFIGEVEWGNLDFLIIDSPPGTGDEPLTVAVDSDGSHDTVAPLGRAVERFQRTRLKCLQHVDRAVFAALVRLFVGSS